MDRIPKKRIGRSKAFLAECRYSILSQIRPRAEDAGKSVWAAALERSTQRIIIFFATIRLQEDGRARIEVDYQGDDPEEFLFLGWRERNAV